MSGAVMEQKAKSAAKTLKIIVTDPLGKAGMDELKKETNIQHEYYSPPHAPFNQERRDNRLLEFK